MCLLSGARCRSRSPPHDVDVDQVLVNRLLELEQLHDAAFVVRRLR
ncbi:hypothetical protein [Kribbella monticola]|nr:hypothetical protein [Kribbella monticola]